MDRPIRDAGHIERPHLRVEPPGAEVPEGRVRRGRHHRTSTRPDRTTTSACPTRHRQPIRAKAPDRSGCARRALPHGPHHRSTRPPARGAADRGDRCRGSDVRRTRPVRLRGPLTAAAPAAVRADEPPTRPSSTRPAGRRPSPPPSSPRRRPTSPPRRGASTPSPSRPRGAGEVPAGHGGQVGRRERGDAAAPAPRRGRGRPGAGSQGPRSVGLADLPRRRVAAGVLRVRHRPQERPHRRHRQRDRLRQAHR